MARQRLISTVHPTERLVGEAPAIVALRAHIRQLVTFDTLGNPVVPTVLLQGETGTGKGLVARVIHESGPRAEGIFVEVNCAAIPESLLEAELFGFEPGAFTDAKRAKPGLWEAASGGILFLDEIDALPLTLQSKLLTIIEAKRVRRLGAVVEHATDVKLIVATQADLRARIRQGQFRADLYHRLAVVLLEVPPLRERGADVLLLALHYLQSAAEAYRLRPKRLDQQAEVWLQRYAWPGNVRELGHLMERVTLLCPDSLIGLEMLERLCIPLAQPYDPAPARPPEGGAESADEAAIIQQALQQTAGNVARAARLLGMSRGAFRHRKARYRVAPSIHGGKMDVALPQEQAGRRMGTAVPQDDGQTVLSSRASPAPTQSWEQKQVAVLALEVTWPVNNEAWASPYEPWTVTSRWEQTIVGKVQGFAGVVLPHSPSLILVAFGVPQTLEQAPQRAVHAALTVRHLVTKVAGEGPFPELRMAVHWGQVLVDTGASDPTAHLLPVGDTLAWPGRLLGYARPGDILVSPEMGRLVEAWCELRARQELPGIGQPDQISAYSVIGLRPLGSSFEMHRQYPLSRFVGRERELAILKDLLGQAREGRGHVVAIIGEPGVGKSRLCSELIKAGLTPDWLILATRADSYGQATPYLPVIEFLRSYFQIASHDDVPTVRAKVTDKLRTLGQSHEASLEGLLSLLDVPAEDAAWQALDPPQRRQRILDAIKRLLVRESQIQPVLLVADNLHWIDSETQAVLESLVEGLPAARLLLLVTYRPEYRHDWGSKAYYAQLRLDPLPPGPAQALLEVLLGDDASLAPLTQSLWQRTQGNPFFLEESVQALIETHVLVGAPGAYRLTKPLQSVQVPPTVQAVLAARIDRLLPQDKRLLQTAAVVGMEVSFALVHAVAGLSEEELRHSLANLQATEFLYEASLLPDLVYTFKHALTHEVAYDSLLQERRRGLHAGIVEALERLDAGRLAEQVERLAHHALRGEMWDKALTYCRQAGVKATKRSAYRGAVPYLEQALGALRHLPDSRDTIEQAIDLRFDLRNALSALGDHAPVLAHLHKAATLAQALGDQHRLGLVFSYMTRQFWQIADFDRALAAGERALAIAAALGDFGLQVATHSFLGQAYYFLGDYRRALDILGRNVASLEGELLGEPFGGGVTTSLHSRTWLVASLAELGAFTEGVAHGEEQLRIAKSIDQPDKVVQASFSTGLLYLRKGDLDRAIATLERGVELCEVWNLGGWVPILPSHLGYAYALSMRVAEAIPLLEQAVRPNVPIIGADEICMTYLSEAYLLAGRREEAIQVAGRALAVSSERNLRGQQAWVLRLLGDIAVQRDPPEVEPAEDRYRQGLALAEELGMRPLQAHCRLGLGTLYAKSGRRGEARTELSAAIELYRAIDMTFWLPQAEAALAEVE
jgi:DNA-binding NtrC family response regulator/tetratricopeptide (TPR) repeat protein/ABC-type thiamine transport system ATPase subunit